MYVLIFEVYFKDHKNPHLTKTFPVMVTSPDTSVIMSEKKMINDHPYWKPYVYAVKQLYLNPEDEDANQYMQYRKELINTEAEYIEQKAERADS